MRKRICAAAGVLALMFALLIFGAAAYEAVNAGHECEGCGCHICEQLEKCERLLSSGAVITAAASVVSCTVILVKRSAAERSSERSDTPVTLGVLLLD